MHISAPEVSLILFVSLSQLAQVVIPDLLYVPAWHASEIIEVNKSNLDKLKLNYIFILIVKSIIYV